MKTQARIRISLEAQSFDPWQILAQQTREDQEAAGDRDVGAISVFVGTMRDSNQGHAVTRMSLEHYPGMTESYLQKVCEKACEKWDIRSTRVVHRYGEISPGDPIVLVAVRASHRDAAFSACRYIIDELKHQAPFWKQEETESGPRWVEPV